MPSTRLPKTHHECRLEVCCACGSAPVKIRLGPSGKSLVQQALPDLAICFDDAKYPLGLCWPCRKALNKLKESNFSNLVDVAKVTEDWHLLPWFDDDEEDFAPLALDSRTCECKICKAVKTGIGSVRPNVERVNPFGTKKRKVGRPSGFSTAVVCKKCLKEVEEGEQHRCTLANRRSSLLKLAKSDPQGSQMIASSVVKSLKGSPLKNTKRLAQLTGGPPLQVYDTPPVRRRSKPIGATATASLAADTGLSVNKRRQLASIANRESKKGSTSGRKVFAPNVNRDITAMKKKFSEHFEVSEEIVDGKPYKIARVRSIEQFVKFITDCRDLIPSNILNRVSLDSGQNFLKMSVNIIDLLNCDDPERLSGKKDLHQFGSRNSLDTGINGTFITCIAQEMAESPEAFETFFDLVSLKDLDNYRFANDFKVHNLLSGLGPCSSSCPCPYCDKLKKYFNTKGNERTIGGISETFEQFQSKNGPLDYPAEFDSVCREPVMPGFPPSTPILHAIPPPELHLMEGITNHVLTKIRRDFPQFKEFMETLGLNKEKYEKYTSKCNYEGNDCKKILNHIDSFISFSVFLAAHSIQPHLHFLRAFAKVVSSCFGFKLLPDYAEKFRLAREAFDFLVSATAEMPGKRRVRYFYKVHVLLMHVEDFVDEFGPLGPFSEQAGETLHSEWLKVWVRHRALPFPPERRLFLALVEWNFARYMRILNSQS